ncbi:hypothetical protein CJ030_MR6G006794 [Morella rubra]|uniref:Uncharacterized protein n=1 Tax=Morella rubra TaxID=262757 RepID=A0A6A1V9C9_9ROSI|nr:hypothetical protein CJ030_MR6G006794 [Morella rubra]
MPKYSHPTQQLVFLFLDFEVYPTVKVMVHEQDHDQIPVPPRNDTGISLLFLRTSEILSKQGSTKNIDGTNKNTRHNIKANPALRPRAVLSSPDNDGMIGSRNRFLEDKSSKSIKVKLPAQAKIMDNQVKAARLLNTKEGSKEISEDKSSLTLKQNA